MKKVKDLKVGERFRFNDEEFLKIADRNGGDLLRILNLESYDTSLLPAELEVVAI